MDQQTRIDAEKFAFHFMDSVKRDDKVVSEDPSAAAKEALATYLEAYYLAQRFNNLENNFFTDENHHKPSAYQKILSELNQY